MAPTDRLLVTIVIITIFMSSADLLGDEKIDKLLSKSSATVEVLATFGETVVLPCDPDSPTIRWDNISIKWYKDNKHIKMSSKYSLLGVHKSRKNTSGSGKYDIKIRGVEQSDAGVWQCRQQNFPDSNQVVSHPIRLTIASMPSHPRITSNNEETVYQESSVITIAEGEDLSIKCIVPDASPPVKHVDWFLEESNVTSASSVYFRRQDTDDVHPNIKELYTTTSSLKLSVVREYNNKALHCQPHHPLWTSSNPSVYVVLNVIYKPRFVLARSPGFGTPIIEGAEVSLHCKINSNPPSLPYWVKDTPKMSDSAKSDSVVLNKDSVKDGFLNFSSIHRSDVGWYRCSTDHKLGHFASFGFFLSVKHAPQIVSAPPKIIEAELGDDVLLECCATGSPAPSFRWSKVKGRHRSKHRNNKNSKTFRNDSDKHSIKNSLGLEDMGLEQNLLLDKLLYNDSGSYACTASNKIANKHRHAHSHIVKLNVKGRPIVEPVNRAVRVMVGRPASLSVTVCANPPPKHVFWIVGSKAITPGKSLPGYKALKLIETDKSGCFLSSLEIDKISEQDGGEVFVIAKNNKGVHDGVIQVNLTTASYSKSAGQAARSNNLVTHTCSIVVLAIIIVQYMLGS